MSKGEYTVGDIMRDMMLSWILLGCIFLVWGCIEMRRESSEPQPTLVERQIEDILREQGWYEWVATDEAWWS